MLKNQSATVDRFMTMTVAPVHIHTFELSTAATLLKVEVLSVFVSIDRSSAPIAPKDSEKCRPVTRKFRSFLHESTIRHRTLDQARRCAASPAALG